MSSNSHQPGAGRPVFLAGPTGAGKTAVSIELAGLLNAEIVGADAFQIYRGMAVLTAQPAAAQRAEVRHHLIGCIPPSLAFDAKSYLRHAETAISEIRARGKQPLIVGGTGLYFRALTEGFADTPAPSEALRSDLDKMNLPDLVERLRASDPAAPGQIDLQNRRRVVRAVEICELSGRPLAEFRSRQKDRTAILVCTRDREQLQERISANVDTMFRQGVVGEVEQVMNEIGPTASRAIGFREIRALISGAVGREACMEAIRIATRQYAKRQLTWFRNQTSHSILDLTGIPSPKAAAESALRMLDFA